MDALFSYQFLNALQTIIYNYKYRYREGCIDCRETLTSYFLHGCPQQRRCCQLDNDVTIVAALRDDELE